MSETDLTRKLRDNPWALVPEHAVALRLTWGGYGEEVIACALDVAPESVAGIVRVALRKLAVLPKVSVDGGSER